MISNLLITSSVASDAAKVSEEFAPDGTSMYEVDDCRGIGFSGWSASLIDCWMDGEFNFRDLAALESENAEVRTTSTSRTAAEGIPCKSNTVILQVAIGRR